MGGVKAALPLLRRRRERRRSTRAVARSPWPRHGEWHRGDHGGRHATVSGAHRKDPPIMPSVLQGDAAAPAQRRWACRRVATVGKLHTDIGQRTSLANIAGILRESVISNVPPPSVCKEGLTARRKEILMIDVCWPWRRAGARAGRAHGEIAGGSTGRARARLRPRDSWLYVRLHADPLSPALSHSAGPRQPIIFCKAFRQGRTAGECGAWQLGLTLAAPATTASMRESHDAGPRTRVTTSTR